MVSRAKELFDRFAVRAARLDMSMTRYTNRAAAMPYLPLAFLGIPFGIAGVYVMTGVAMVAMFALPNYGRRVEATRPGLVRPAKPRPHRQMPPEVRRRNQTIFVAVAILGGIPLGIQQIRYGDAPRGWLLLGAVAIVLVGFGMNAAAGWRRRGG